MSRRGVSTSDYPGIVRHPAYRELVRDDAGVGFRISGFQDSGVEGCGPPIWGYEYAWIGSRVSGLGSRVSGLGFHQAQTIGSPNSRLESNKEEDGFRVPGLGF
jgi:hypothetical protein